MAEPLPTLFCDGIIEANVTHGVVRITLGQLTAEGKAVPCGRLVLPLAQLAGTAQTIAAILRQVEERLGRANAPPAPPAGAAPP